MFAFRALPVNQRIVFLIPVAFFAYGLAFVINFRQRSRYRIAAGERNIFPSIAYQRLAGGTTTHRQLLDDVLDADTGTQR